MLVNQPSLLLLLLMLLAVRVGLVLFNSHYIQQHL